MWKMWRSPCAARNSPSRGDVEKSEAFSTVIFKGSIFHSVFFLFHRKPGKTTHRLELMLVLISLTVSAKAGSFFIFFSTCWME